MTNWQENKAIKKFFGEKPESKHSSENVSWGYVYGKDKLLDFGWQYCHAKAKVLDYSPHYVMTRIRKPNGCSTKEALIYYHWLTNSSPWASCFLSKDPEYIQNNGYVMDVSTPCSLFYQALIQSRASFDSYYSNTLSSRIKIFADFVKQGYDPAHSFIFSQTFGYDKGYIYSPVNTGHTALATPRYSWKSWSNFCNHKRISTPSYNLSYKDAKGNNGCIIHFLWDKGAEHNPIDTLKTEIESLPYPSKSRKISLNIFAEKPTTVALTEEDAKYFVTYMEKKLNAQS